MTGLFRVKIFHSIRWRLLLWYGATLGMILAGLGTISYQHEQTQRLVSIDRNLQSRLSLLAGALQPADRHHPENSNDNAPSDGHHNPDDGKGDGGDHHPNNPDSADSSANGQKKGKTFHLSADEIAQLVGPEGYYYAVQPHNRPLVLSSNAPVGLALPTDEQGGLRTRGLYREAWLFPARQDCVLAGISLAGEQAGMRDYLALLVALGFGVLAVALVGGWVLTTRALEPIAFITTAAGEIAAGDRSRRIDVNETESELGGLAQVLNATFARLEANFEDQARFTADAAHELRTPVSVILLHAQTALADDRLDPGQRASIEACERGAQRLRGLIESLLQLARLDAQSDPVTPKRIDLAEVAGEMVESLRIVAARRDVTLALETAPVEVCGVPAQLWQVVTNLVGNAIHHGRAGGHVRVIVRSEGSDAVLEVVDDGPGIAEKHAARVFERFYRGDEARTGTAGRTGLGLAIAKAIIEAHHGTITLHSREGQGATFRVRLPREV